MSRQRMTISWDDLNSENVEKKIQQQQAISQARDHYEHAQFGGFFGYRQDRDESDVHVVLLL